MENKKEISYYNYLKAFAAILVVVHHAIVYSPLFDNSTFLNTIYLFAVNVHVPLFFCVAGYLCHSQPIKKFYSKKIVKILIPFIVFSVLKLVYSNVISNAHSHGSTLSAQIYDALICGNLYWFAYAILIMFAVAPILWKLGRYNIILFFAFIAVNMILEFTNIAVTDILQLQSTLSYICYFIAGFILQDFKEQTAQIKQSFRNTLLVFCIILSACILYLRITETIPYLHYWLKVPLTFSLMYILYFISRILPQNLRLLEYLGKHALQIMFLDSFYKVILFALLKPSSVALLAITIVINISLTVISCYVIKKIPFVRTLCGL